MFLHKHRNNVNWKRIGGGLLAVLLGVVLTGCIAGGNNANNTVPTNAVAANTGNANANAHTNANANTKGNEGSPSEMERHGANMGREMREKRLPRNKNANTKTAR